MNSSRYPNPWMIALAGLMMLGLSLVAIAAMFSDDGSRHQAGQVAAGAEAETEGRITPGLFHVGAHRGARRVKSTLDVPGDEARAAFAPDEAKARRDHEVMIDRVGRRLGKGPIDGESAAELLGDIGSVDPRVRELPGVPEVSDYLRGIIEGMRDDDGDKVASNMDGLMDHVREVNLPSGAKPANAEVTQPADQAEAMLPMLESGARAHSPNVSERLIDVAKNLVEGKKALEQLFAAKGNPEEIMASALALAKPAVGALKALGVLNENDLKKVAGVLEDIKGVLDTIGAIGVAVQPALMGTGVGEVKVGVLEALSLIGKFLGISLNIFDPGLSGPDIGGHDGKGGGGGGGDQKNDAKSKDDSNKSGQGGGGPGQGQGDAEPKDPAKSDGQDAQERRSDPARDAADGAVPPARSDGTVNPKQVDPKAVGRRIGEAVDVDPNAAARAVAQAARSVNRQGGNLDRETLVNAIAGEIERLPGFNPGGRLKKELNQDYAAARRQFRADGTASDVKVRAIRAALTARGVNPNDAKMLARMEQFLQGVRLKPGDDPTRCWLAWSVYAARMMGLGAPIKAVPL